jgi:hypothetical protein
MVKINWNKIEDAKGGLLPQGSYIFMVGNVEERHTKAGDDMWNLRLDCQTKDLEGKSVYDNLVFTEKALPRVKLACKAFGIDVSGEMDLTPAMLISHKAMVDVEVEDYETTAGGMKKRNIVPYAGYHSIAGAITKKAPAATKPVASTTAPSLPLPAASELDGCSDEEETEDAERPETFEGGDLPF